MADEPLGLGGEGGDGGGDPAPDPVIEQPQAGADDGAGAGGGGDTDPKAKKPDGGTIAGEEGGDTDGQPGPADWPDDWREKLAGTDERMLARLKRFASPANVLKSWRELETRVSSGEFKKSLPADATPEQVAAYRKENGVPDKPEGYFDALGGLVIGDADKPIVKEFLESAHGRNRPPEEVKQTLEWYYATQERLAQERAEADTAYRANAVEELRAELGPEFKPTFTALKAWVAGAGDDVADGLFGARMPDGTLLGDNPPVLRWLISQMRELNPVSTVVPGASGAGAMQTIESEIKEIETLMRENSPAYWRDESKQKRLRDLYTAQEKATKRVA